MLGASGTRRRYRLCMRTASNIPLVRRTVGTSVLGSMKADQSRALLGWGAELEESEPINELARLVFSCCVSSLCDLELHGGHRISTHAPAVAEEEVYYVRKVVDVAWAR